jgi:hypothetical protein
MSHETGAPHTLAGDAYLLQKLTQLAQGDKDVTALEILGCPEAKDPSNLRRLLVSPPPSRQPQSAKFLATRDDIVKTGFRIGSIKEFAELIENKEWERAALCMRLALDATHWTDGLAKRVLDARPLDDPWLKILRTSLFAYLGTSAKPLWLAQLRYQVLLLTGQQEDLDLIRDFCYYTNPSYKLDYGVALDLAKAGQLTIARRVWAELDEKERQRVSMPQKMRDYYFP